LIWWSSFEVWGIFRSFLNLSIYILRFFFLCSYSSRFSNMLLSLHLCYSRLFSLEFMISRLYYFVLTCSSRLFINNIRSSNSFHCLWILWINSSALRVFPILLSLRRTKLSKFFLCGFVGSKLQFCDEVVMFSWVYLESWVAYKFISFYIDDSIGCCGWTYSILIFFISVCSYYSPII
jgi:hypothetical protein